MILGFMQYWDKAKTEPTRFKEKILAGEKKHTIRLDPHDRWYAGRSIQFAYGVRTPQYECFLAKKCKSIQTIEIIHNENGAHKLLDKGIWVKVDDIVMSDFWVRELAFNDGFGGHGKDPVYLFFKWFNTDYKGKIIHWTNLIYNK